MNIQEIRQQYPQYQDLTDRQLVKGLHTKFYADIPYADFLRKIDFSERVDPTEGMNGMEKFRAGAGKAFYDIGRGVKQITGNADQAEIDQAKALDAPLMNTGAGIGGNILGNAAILAPTMFIPGANTYTGAALIGGAAGALQPTATGESRTINTGLGAASGVAGQAIGNAVGRMVSPVTSRLGPEEAQLARAATKEGIPLSAGERMGSRPLQVMESVMENLPLTSGPQLAQRDAQQRAFTAAVLKRGGMTGDVADAATLLARKQALGNEMGAIAKRGGIDFSQGLNTQLDDIAANAARHLPPSKAADVAGVVANIKNQAAHQSALTGRMTGDTYQGWREPLRGLASNTESGSYYQQIRNALDTAFRNQIPASEAEAFKGASRQYANTKTIIDAMGGPGAMPAKGQIPPAQLSRALTAAMGREGKALGRGDLNELNRIGQVFVKDQIPNSGTPQRQFLTKLMTGNLTGAFPGAALGYYEGGPEGAVTGGLIGAGATLAGPRMAQVLMNSPAGQAWLKNELMSPAGRQLLTNALRTGAVGSVPALTSE